MTKTWIPHWLDNVCNHNVIPEDASDHLQVSSIKLNDNIVGEAVNSTKDKFENKEVNIKTAAKTRLTQIVDETIDAALVLEGTILDNTGQSISTWTGSAFLIQSNIAVTNSHTVVEPDTQRGEQALHIVSLDGEEFYEVNLLARNENIDISVFEILDFPGHSYLTLGNSDLIELGEKIIVLGSPEGWENTATFGHAVNTEKSIESGGESWQDLIFIDAFIANGSSGGAVVDMDGNVIGVVIGIIGQHSSIGVGMNAIIPINKVKNFLSDHNIAYQEG